MLGQCWAAVFDVGPTLTQHWFNVSCLLGRRSQRRGFIILNVTGVYSSGIRLYNNNNSVLDAKADPCIIHDPAIWSLHEPPRAAGYPESQNTASVHVGKTELLQCIRSWLIQACVPSLTEGVCCQDEWFYTLIAVDLTTAAHVNRNYGFRDHLANTAAAAHAMPAHPDQLHMDREGTYSRKLQSYTYYCFRVKFLPIFNISHHYHDY